jgi:hypothetical protein
LLLPVCSGVLIDQAAECGRSTTVSAVRRERTPAEAPPITAPAPAPGAPPLNARVSVVRPAGQAHLLAAEQQWNQKLARDHWSLHPLHV